MGVSEHASKQYDLDLDSIRSRVLQMGGLVESQIRRALDALASGDRARIDEEAQKIARMARSIHERGSGPPPHGVDVRHAAEVALSMLRRALDAFARLDVAAAADVIRDDAAIDSEFRSVLRQLITFMMEDPRTISTALEVIWVAKAIERIGDHAKNMAEYVIYIVKGTDVRHTDPTKILP